MDFNEDDVRSLIAKLEALELTEGERAALDTLYAAAGDDDTVGFSTDVAEFWRILSNVLQTSAEISMTSVRNLRA